MAGGDLAVMLPDAEALLIVALRAVPAVSTAAGGRISTRLSGIYPAVRVTLLGGPARTTANTATPELQVECWGNGSDTKAETEASDLARLIESVIPDLAGSYNPGRLISAYVNGFLLHSPDSATARERYLFPVGLILQP